MTQPSFFDNPNYFHLFQEFAEFDLIKMQKLTPELKKQFNARVVTKKKMDYEQKREFLLNLVNSSCGTKRDTTNKTERKEVVKKALLYFRKMERKRLVTEGQEDAKKFNVKVFNINWKGFTDAFMNYLKKNYSYKINNQYHKDEDNSLQIFEVTETLQFLEPEIKISFIRALSTPLIKTFNDFFEYFFKLGVTSAGVSQGSTQYYPTEYSIELFFSPLFRRMSQDGKIGEKIPIKLNPAIAFAFCVIFIDFVIYKEKLRLQKVAPI
jgi:hypothetical protein